MVVLRLFVVILRLFVVILHLVLVIYGSFAFLCGHFSSLCGHFLSFHGHRASLFGHFLSLSGRFASLCGHFPRLLAHNQMHSNMTLVTATATNCHNVYFQMNQFRFGLHPIIGCIDGCGLYILPHIFHPSAPEGHSLFIWAVLFHVLQK